MNENNPIERAASSSAPSSSADAPKQPELSPERWLAEYGDILFRMTISRVRNQHVAEDIVQEALVSAWRSKETFAGRSNELTWLVGILKRRIADYYRKYDRQVQFSTDSTFEQNSIGSTEKEAPLNLVPSMDNQAFESCLEADEFREIVNDCLRLMPIHLRQAFQIRLENISTDISRLSQLVGISPNNLSVRLYRARLLMRTCVERRWSE